MFDIGGIAVSNVCRVAPLAASHTPTALFADAAQTIGTPVITRATIKAAQGDFDYVKAVIAHAGSEGAFANGPVTLSYQLDGGAIVAIGAVTQDGEIFSGLRLRFDTNIRIIASFTSTAGLLNPRTLAGVTLITERHTRNTPLVDGGGALAG